jgi:hypothetical protein
MEECMSAAAGTWTPLMPAAMVGTDRHAAPLPAWPGEIGATIAEAVRDAEPAQAVLRAAAVLAVCAQAGTQPMPWPHPRPEAAADDPSAVPDDAMSAGLEDALRDGGARLQFEACRALGAAGMRLPHALLPAALELGRRSLALRVVLDPVLGARGRWLASLRDDWRYASGAAAGADPIATWTEGTLEQRVAFLARERASDPAAARARLAEALPELPARERAELLAVFTHGLGPDDEALLDDARGDRSGEVRQVALALLLRLPHAAHPARAAARLTALMRHERVLLRKRWLIEAPAQADDAWKADGVVTTRPAQDSLGDRAWWLYQLVRQVPLSWWKEHTGMDAAELRRWADGTDWAEALLRGWRDVLFAAPAPDWCEAFLAAWPVAWRDHPASVLALLPLAARERHWQGRLDEPIDRWPVLVHEFLAACPLGETLSRPFSIALAERLRRFADTRALADAPGLRGPLAELCGAMHVDALQRLATWPADDEDTPALAATRRAVLQLIAARRALLSLSPTSLP